MTAQTAVRDIELGTEDVDCVASLAAALRAVGIVSQVQLYEQGLTINRSGSSPSTSNSRPACHSDSFSRRATTPLFKCPAATASGLNM